MVHTIPMAATARKSGLPCGWINHATVKPATAEMTETVNASPRVILPDGSGRPGLLTRSMSTSMS